MILFRCLIGYLPGISTDSGYDNQSINDLTILDSNKYISIITTYNVNFVNSNKTIEQYISDCYTSFGDDFNNIWLVPFRKDSYLNTVWSYGWIPSANQQYPIAWTYIDSLTSGTTIPIIIICPDLQKAFTNGRQFDIVNGILTYKSSKHAPYYTSQGSIYPIITNYTDGMDLTTATWLFLNSTTNTRTSRNSKVETRTDDETVMAWLLENNPTPIIEETDPYSNIDGLGEITGGGTGTVGIPGFPPISATSTGILGLFAPSTSEMQQLSDYMWTDFGGTGTTEVDVLKEIVQALKRTISNPLDYVTGLSIIPSQGLNIGSSQVIKFGFTSSGVSMPRLSSQYFTVDCGSINFDALCGDTFLDYAPYSKFSIYLPYIGCKTLDANDCVGHTISVVYHGDVVTGGVTAYVTKDGSVMYQYSGCCSLNIPLSADSWGTTISGAVQVATSMIASASTPGVAGVAKTAIAGAANVASNPSMLSPQIEHSGAISGGAGCMGVQYPYIIREAVRFHSTQGFNREHGYPSFYYRKLSDVSGFTIIYDTHIDNISATPEEISEIEDLLKSGVIL